MKKSLLTPAKERWQELKGSAPGERFKTAHANACRRRRTTPLWHRVVQLGLAVVALVLGVIFAFIPGPAFVFFALAGALLATESRAVAGALDWWELGLRAFGRWAQRQWKRMGLLGRIAVTSTGAVGVLAVAALMGWILFVRW
jgi:hypothetical protein